MSAYDRIRLLLDGDDAVVLDGGVGSELVRRGVRWRGHGLRTDPEAVHALHAEYVAAGADVIGTNTLQLNPRIYRNVWIEMGGRVIGGGCGTTPEHIAAFDRALRAS